MDPKVGIMARRTWTEIHARSAQTEILSAFTDAVSRTDIDCNAVEAKHSR